jgi:uncharacterized sulfatase
MREYLASVREVDRNIGRVMDRLEELGIKDETIVIFASDHGYNMGHNGIWHKGNGHWIVQDPPEATENIPKGDRPNMWDTSLYVPASVRWPGVIEPGSKVDEQISLMDFYPTILAMAGVEPPEDITIRGRNFLPLLKGKTVDDWRTGFYAQYSTHHQSRTKMRSWRTEKWKLVRDFLNPRRDELYNLKADPDESNNLIDSDAPAAKSAKKRLHQKILQRMKQIDDPALKHVDQ